jgi:tryptophanyl-tRNA synthetase
VKDRLARALNVFLEPIRDRRSQYASNMGAVRDALEQGTTRARAAAEETMALVRDALDLGYFKKFR